MFCYFGDNIWYYSFCDQQAYKSLGKGTAQIAGLWPNPLPARQECAEDTGVFKQRPHNGHIKWPELALGLWGWNKGQANHQRPFPAPGASDRVQDMLLQNIATWQIETFKLKKFEKGQVQEGLSNLLQKQVIRPSWERVSYTQRKGAVLSPKMERHRTKVLLSFPPFITVSSYPLFYHIFPPLPTLHQT